MTRTPRVLRIEDGTDATAVDLPPGRALCFTRPAPGREGPNEDAAMAIEGRDGTHLIAVADGVGGHAFGAQASRLALDTLATAVAEGKAIDRSAIIDGIELANHKVRALGSGAACTLSVAHLVGPVVRTFQVGDSVSMVVGQRGRLKHQSIAHGPTGYAVHSGLLDEDEAMAHEEAHIVTNVIGDENMHIELGTEITLAARDTLLVASDGVTDNLYTRELIDLIRAGPLDQSSRRLVQRVDQRMRAPLEDEPSKPDDLTFILYRRS